MKVKGTRPVTSSNEIKGAERIVSEFPQSYSGKALLTSAITLFGGTKVGFNAGLQTSPWDIITDQHVNDRIV